MTPNAFGYTDDPIEVGDITAVQVAEGKHPDTLEPLVIVFLRTAQEPNQVAYAFPLVAADHLAAELQRWAARAREKHWDPDA